MHYPSFIPTWIYFLFLFVPDIFGQKFAPVEPIQKEKLLKIAEEAHSEFARIRINAIEKANQFNLPISGRLADGRKYLLESFEGNMPRYVVSNNLGAAVTTGTVHLQPGGRSGHGLTGSGLTIGMWEVGGGPRLTHQEFSGRIIQRDNPPEIAHHATRVAGTLLASGVISEAKGMASDALMWAYDYNNHSSEMAIAASMGLLISNHSYGAYAGFAWGDFSLPGTSEWHWWGNTQVSELEDFYFGYYDNVARIWDNISYTAPFYTIVKSAGNDRHEVGGINHKAWINNQWTSSNQFRYPDGGEDGHDCLPSYSTAKNIITVGAVSKIAGGYTSPNQIVMTEFSSWGPTDDGRIKPDLIGPGLNMLTPSSENNFAYSIARGTSFAAPTVAGSLLILQELHERYFGTFMKSATLKGLAIHTADQANLYPGPDYKHGWGLLNAERAANAITDPLFHTIIETSLQNNEVKEIPIFSDGSSVIKITMCWTDLPGIVHTPALNNPALKLINDLDMILISETDENFSFSPYILDPSNPAQPAQTGDNFRDNVEVIEAGIIPAGYYTLRISHKSVLQNGHQDFSLIISAPVSSCLNEEVYRFTQYIPCSGGMLDSLEVIPTNGPGPHTFSIRNSGFQSENLFYNLETGVYNILIKDSTGCLSNQTITIESPQPIQISIEERLVFNISDSGVPTENLPFIPSGNFSWGGDINDQFIESDLVLAIDGTSNPNSGCNPLINSNEVSGNIAIVFRGNCTDGRKALRAQQAGAKAVIIINHETGSEILNGGNDGPAIQIPVVLVSREIGDQLLTYASENSNPTFSMGRYLPFKNESCPGYGDGFAELTITGGTPPYQYLWNDGTASLTLEAGAGIYTFLVEDQSGCQSSLDIEITVASRPNPLMIIRHENCLGDSDGFARLANQSVFSNYQLQYSNGVSGPINPDLSPGDYVLELTDMTGCVLSTSFTIEPGADVTYPDIKGPDYLVPGELIQFSVDLNSEEVNLVWSVGGGTILEGQGTNELLVLADEEIEELEVQISARKDRCTRTSTLLLEAFNTSAYTSNKPVKITVFPNPASESLFIEMDDSTFTNGTSVKILHSNGKLLTVIPASTKMEIPLQHLASGVYMVQIEQEVFKFVKE